MVGSFRSIFGVWVPSVVRVGAAAVLLLAACSPAGDLVTLQVQPPSPTPSVAADVPLTAIDVADMPHCVRQPRTAEGQLVYIDDLLSWAVGQAGRLATLGNLDWDLRNAGAMADAPDVTHELDHIADDVIRITDRGNRPGDVEAWRDIHGRVLAVMHRVGVQAGQDSGCGVDVVQEDPGAWQHTLEGRLTHAHERLEEAIWESGLLMTLRDLPRMLRGAEKLVDDQELAGELVVLAEDAQAIVDVDQEKQAGCRKVMLERQSGDPEFEQCYRVYTESSGQWQGIHDRVVGILGQLGVDVHGS